MLVAEILRDSERWLANFRLDHQPSREAKIQILFEGLTETEFGATTNIRLIENAAVAATLVDLAESTGSASSWTKSRSRPASSKLRYGQPMASQPGSRVFCGRLADCD